MPKQNCTRATKESEKELIDKLRTIAKGILEDSSKGVFTFGELLDRAEYSLFSLGQERLKTGFRRIASSIPEVLNQINTARLKGGHVPGLSTGLKELDDVLVGLKPGCLYANGGHPAVGKTGFALTILRNVARDTHEAVGFFSLQLSASQVVARLLGIEAQLDSHLLRTGKLSKGQFIKLVEASDKLKSTYIYIDDTPWISPSKLQAKARRLKAECDIKLLIIDYLQLIKRCEDSVVSTGEVRKICQMVKLLATELDIPILLLSTLPGQLAERKDRRPRLYDFQFADIIYESADVILLLHRPWIHYGKEYDPEEVEVIVAKNYNSSTGTVKLKFIPGYAGFESLS